MDDEAKKVASQILAMPEVRELRAIFDQHKKEIRLVGGVVRDILLGVQPKDYDLATTALPTEVLGFMESAGVKCLATGLQHGTVTVVINKIHFEVTTLRIDEAHDGRWAEVRFTDDWSQDALRRDLTVNAMSIDMAGQLHDYFDGLAHLTARRILFVGDASTRIIEDYLRILRYFRFHGRLSYDHLHDPPTLEAISANAAGLQRISGERIWQELQKILMGQQATELLAVMLRLGVLANIGLADVTSRDIAEFSRVRRFVTTPIAALTALLSSEAAFIALCERYHLATAEKILGVFILQRRASPSSVEQAQNDLVDRTPTLHVLELLRYQEQIVAADAIAAWPVPTLPVGGKDLKQHGVPAGPAMGCILASLKAKWVDSRFRLTKDELMSIHLPALISSPKA